ncbi:uncharacterized protein LOC128994083 [Macrosteles quadrilineatus]|uniref:uncharacterized protein LOC128994083 n=1 Tax=Macrosteles quadrilineatus TaxID=74068 RepID=UPI0023E26D59|nr:uncharacterized protein LOC128994083 [Macrosteles quadrilineatus]
MYFSFETLFILAIISEFTSVCFCNSEIDPFDFDSIPAPKPGWIDPFDMFGESSTSNMPRPTFGENPSKLFVQSDMENHILQKRCSSSETFLRRFVNLFVNALDSQKDKNADESVYQVITLEFTVSGKDINILREYGQSENNAQTSVTFSDIITKLFSQKRSPPYKTDNRFTDISLLLKKTYFKVTSSPEWTVFSSVVLLVFFTLWLIYHSHSYRLALFTVFLTIFMAGFGFNWIRMYEEEESKRFTELVINGNAPRHCTAAAQSMVWYEHMYYRMFGVNCQEFYIRRDVRPIVKVSPVDALSHTFTSMLVNPAIHIGKAYGLFVTSINDQLAWYVKPIALPFIFIIPLVFIIIICAFVFNYRLSLSITGIHLIPTWSRLSEPEVGREKNYVEECPRKETENSQQSNTFSSFLETNTPLFIMNWNGLKKFSSSNLIGDKGKNKTDKDTEKILKDSDNHLKDEDSDEKLMEDLQEFEQFVDMMENKKLLEEMKKRSTDKVKEGKNLSVISKCEMQEGAMVVRTLDNENRTYSYEKEKDSKNKTI